MNSRILRVVVQGGSGEGLRLTLALATLMTGLAILFDIAPESPIAVWLPRALGALVTGIGVAKLWSLETGQYRLYVTATYAGLFFWGYFVTVILIVTGGRVFAVGPFGAILIGTFLLLRESGAIMLTDPQRRTDAP